MFNRYDEIVDMVHRQVYANHLHETRSVALESIIHAEITYVLNVLLNFKDVKINLVSDNVRSELKVLIDKDTCHELTVFSNIDWGLQTSYSGHY